MQVERIIFQDVSEERCKAVLEGVGSRLKKLKFDASWDRPSYEEIIINLAHLQYSTSLEELEIGWKFEIESTALDIPLENFLPRLKDLSVYMCLNQSSHFFERPFPSLIELKLHCCHLGIPGVCEFNWMDLPVLWPNLKTLDVGYARNLSLDILLYILPRMAQLKCLTLPKYMLQSEEEEQWIAELKQHLPQIFLSFDTSISDRSCHFHQLNIENWE